jgi:hypothetical protein
MPIRIAKLLHAGLTVPPSVLTRTLRIKRPPEPAVWPTLTITCGG